MSDVVFVLLSTSGRPLWYAARNQEAPLPGCTNFVMPKGWSHNSSKSAITCAAKNKVHSLSCFSRVLSTKPFMATIASFRVSPSCLSLALEAI